MKTIKSPEVNRPSNYIVWGVRWWRLRGSSIARDGILWMHTLLQINSNNRYVFEPGLIAPILYLNPKNHLYTETKGFIRRVFREQSRTLEKIGIGRRTFFLCALNFFQYFMFQGFYFFTNCAFHMLFSEETNILQLKKIKPCFYLFFEKNKTQSCRNVGENKTEKHRINS